MFCNCELVLKNIDFVIVLLPLSVIFGLTNVAVALIMIFNIQNKRGDISFVLEPASVFEIALQKIN